MWETGAPAAQAQAQASQQPLMGPRLRRNGCFLAPLLLEELVGETGTVLLDAGAGTLAVTINGGTAHVLFNDTCPAKDGS